MIDELAFIITIDEWAEHRNELGRKRSGGCSAPDDELA